ncbi:hypothetical protein ACPOL_6824 (plasmid) [Acidisarcina polymorpha]|uniref:Uncharacterized protein n=1 Tax=Acidisarcina polymorpha TaxID=2211140 RepID=A0A2Z5GBE8_9BACT|nr:hypothetical protein ACPOL_6824 [Acidisarcina polymorpha]
MVPKGTHMIKRLFDRRPIEGRRPRHDRPQRQIDPNHAVRESAIGLIDSVRHKPSKRVPIECGRAPVIGE